MPLGLYGVLSRIEELRAALGLDAMQATTVPPSAVPADRSHGESFAASLASALGRPTGTADANAHRYAELIRQAANRYGVDERLVHAVVRAESGYNPRAVSRAGAMGLMQLMPENCQEFGVSDPFDPAQNLDAGVRHLRQMLDRFGRLDLALAAYNAGPGAVRRYGGIPPYRETQAYVRRILGWLNQGE